MTPISVWPGDVALFAADMHLGDHDPATAALFLDVLDRHSRGASHLFLLGDLFEAWVGDDQPDAQAAALIEKLATLSARGVRIYVMRGNRDFLLDVPFPASVGQAARKPFSARARVTMIDDPCTVALFGREVLLMHGDTLCTGDVEYQEARRMARSAQWQDDFLRRPLDERLTIARRLRGESRRAQAARAAPAGPGEDTASPANPGDALLGKTRLGDVEAAAVEAALRNANTRTLIHGHTHRPACHRGRLDDQPTERWVLPDWHAARSEDDTDRGGLLRVDSGGWTTCRA